MIHVLCTGGSGYVGSHTVVALEATGKYKTTIVDNHVSSSVMSALEKLCSHKIPAFELDLCDAAAVDKLFAEQKFDAVIHFAALKAVGESVSKPLEYYENNLVSVLNILKSMKKHNCKVFVQSSSATVYAPSDEKLKEDFPIKASNPYGQTKVMIETILTDFQAANKDFKISILRYFNPVGAHPSGEIGEAPEHPNNLLPTVQQAAVGKRECVFVFGNDYNTPDGTGVRDYVHVDDLAEGHSVALDKLFSLPEGAILTHNLGTGRGTSVLELIHTFEKVNGVKVNYKIEGRRPGDIGRAVADVTKVNTEWSWYAKRTIEDACATAWKFQSSHK